MFDTKISNYLEEEMGICLVHLIEEINKFPKDKCLIIKYLEKLIDFKLPYEKFTLGSEEFYLNEESFEKLYLEFLEENKIEGKDSYYIFDNLRHAFNSFKFGGLIQLYERAEKEGWYPKILINKFLGKYEDLKELKNTIDIFRGTSLEEYENDDFSQSWTFDISIANGFAYSHYCGQASYSNTQRIVIKTTIFKEMIFYYDKNNVEKEVIVNPTSIKKDNVEVISNKIIY